MPDTIAPPATAAPAPAATPAPPTPLPEAFRRRFASPTTEAPPEDPTAVKPPAADPAAPAAPVAAPADPKAEPKAGDPAAPAAPAAEPTAAPAKRVIKRAAGYENAPSPAADNLATAATKLAAAADRLAGAAPATPAAPEIAMSKGEKRQHEVFEQMGKMSDKYKELAANSKRFLTDLPEATTNWEKGFRLNWEKKHKDEDFENEREREAAFNEALSDSREGFIEKQREKYGLSFDEDDFEEAKEKLMEERLQKPVNEKLAAAEREIEALRRGKRREEAAPVAKEKAAAAVNDFAVNVAQVDPAFEGLVTADGKIDKEKADALGDPEIVIPVIEDATNRSRNFAEWTARVFEGDQFDIVPRTSGMTPQQHAAALEAEKGKFESVVRFTWVIEDAIAGDPDPQARVDEYGRQFAKIEQFAGMTPADRAKHWTVSVEDVISRANDSILGHAKKVIETKRKEVEPLLARHGVKLGAPRVAAAGAAATPAAATPAAAPPKPPAAKPTSPTSTDGTPVGTATPATGGGFLQKRFSSGTVSSGFGGSA